MPVSRGRKPKLKKQSQPPSQNPHQLPTPHQKTRWERIRDHPVFWGLGLLAALIAVGAPAYEAFREPEIHAHSGVIQNPFELRFSLRNPSFIFLIKNMNFTCFGEKIILANNIRFENVAFSENIHVSVRPGQTVEYTCPFDRLVGHPNLPTLSAQIAIGVNFKTLWFQRTTASDHFTWTAQSQQWVEGEIIN
jgi:hypothetical protein